MTAENPDKPTEYWLTSSEAKAKLRVSSCHLMHFRQAGQLKFKKKGNSFLYAEEGVRRLIHKPGTK